MATSNEDRLKQQEDYLAFKAIKDEAEALAFLKDRLPSSVGKTYYTPTDYRWATMSLSVRLLEAHSRHWFSIRGLFNIRNRKKDDEKFIQQEDLVIKAIVRNMDHLSDWVSSRYAIPPRSYLLPNEFACFKEEAKDDWDMKDTLHSIESGKSDGYYEDIHYYWQNVEPAEEDAADERRHCILLDMKTREEAPLLPGVEPYMN